MAGAGAPVAGPSRLPRGLHVLREFTPTPMSSAGAPRADPSNEKERAHMHSNAPAAAIPHAAPVIPYRRASTEARTSVLVCPTAWDQRIPPPRRLALRRREKPIVIASKICSTPMGTIKPPYRAKDAPNTNTRNWVLWAARLSRYSMVTTTSPPLSFAARSRAFLVDDETALVIAGSPGRATAGRRSVRGPKIVMAAR